MKLQTVSLSLCCTIYFSFFSHAPGGSSICLYYSKIPNVIIFQSSRGSNVLSLLEEKSEEKRKPKGRPTMTWIDDMLQWTQKNKYQLVFTLRYFFFPAEDGRHGKRRHTNLLTGRWHPKKDKS